jgi:hypothetical protein
MREVKRKEEKKREEKRDGKASKVVSAWNILCRPTCTFAVGLLTRAIRASVVNAHPDRTFIFHNGTGELSAKAVFLMDRPVACGQAA